MVFWFSDRCTCCLTIRVYAACEMKVSYPCATWDSHVYCPQFSCVNVASWLVSQVLLLWLIEGLIIYRCSNIVINPRSVSVNVYGSPSPCLYLLFMVLFGHFFTPCNYYSCCRVLPWWPDIRFDMFYLSCSLSEVFENIFKWRQVCHFTCSINFGFVYPFMDWMTLSQTLHASVG